MFIPINNNDSKSKHIYTPWLEVTVAINADSYKDVRNYLEEETDFEPDAYLVENDIVTDLTFPVIVDIQQISAQVNEFLVDSETTLEHRIGIEYLDCDLALVYRELCPIIDQRQIIIVENKAILFDGTTGQEYPLINVDKNVSSLRCPICGEHFSLNAEDYSKEQQVEGKWMCKKCKCQGGLLTTDNIAYIYNKKQIHIMVLQTAEKITNRMKGV